jgi:hypothetical protein
MSEKSLRAKAIPGLRLGVRSSPALRRPLGTTEMGTRARLTRKEATGCTMPTAWESKKEIPAYSGQPWHRVERLEHMLNWFDKYLEGKNPYL